MQEGASANEAVMSPPATGDDEDKPRMHLGFSDKLPSNIVARTHQNHVQLERVFLRPPCIFWFAPQTKKEEK